MAERAATHRERLNNEIETVIGLLRFAIHQSAARGDHHLVGWMFWGDRQAALDGIRRYKPGFAAELAELEARSKAYVLNMNEQRLKPNPLQGPQKDSIVIGGSVFSMGPNGKILRDGKRTTLRAKPVIERWYLLEEVPEESAKKTRDSNLMDASDALFAAATLLIERENGGPLATICPDLDTWQRSGQSFETPPDPGPPTKIRRDRADRNAPGSHTPTRDARKSPNRSGSEAPLAQNMSDSARKDDTKRKPKKAGKRPGTNPSRKSAQPKR